ncbi:hypothetical protein LR48_Vigan10g260300 [Vigna angularis]|uniref:Uncharacterized protein n=1 Tax=Phaseolus angularis TaxID=3914 RepID=A0A0L9VNR5_PHAAN|nr:hypothetical protein LR48_Vigan10g260300 [Vigna angularis]
MPLAPASLPALVSARMSQQPWQDQLCDQLQQGNPASELQGMTNQVAQLTTLTHFDEVQIHFNAFDLVKVEPIKPAIDTAILMPAHTHILDSVFHVEQIDIPDAVYDVCTEPDHSFDDNFVQCADSIDSVIVAEDNFYESIQVYSNLETPTATSEFPMPFDAFDCMCLDLIEPVSMAGALPTHTLRAMCLLSVGVGSSAQWDDSIVHINFDLDVVDDILSSGTDIEEVAYTEGTKVTLWRGFKKALRQASYILNVSTEGVNFDIRKDVYQSDWVPIGVIPAGTFPDDEPTEMPTEARTTEAAAKIGTTEGNSGVPFLEDAPVVSLV